ncbi:hypothetical protein SAMN04487950_3137 [Halogranum rubrum]|uniref:Uncharacterized protein n=1 Tax=Halogranum rubrum TaxID=553466 RepID=A0A1I4GA88_9EURY|nr:hypothetical protein [Halogranum rubrum]SFL26789.1 hypothetical protein SAMN04487950_3137 [Halogranum rubrum]
MDSRTRSFAIAGFGGLSSVAVLVYSWQTLSSVSEGPRGDGFVAGLVAAFGLALGLSALVVAFDAVVLAASERFARLDGRQRLVLQTGCGFAALGHAALAIPWERLGLDPVLYQFGGWLGLVGLGTVLTLLGGLWVVASSARHWASTRQSA